MCTMSSAIVGALKKRSSDRAKSVSPMRLNATVGSLAYDFHDVSQVLQLDSFFAVSKLI